MNKKFIANTVVGLIAIALFVSVFATGMFVMHLVIDMYNIDPAMIFFIGLASIAALAIAPGIGQEIRQDIEKWR